MIRWRMADGGWRIRLGMPVARRGAERIILASDPIRNPPSAIHNSHGSSGFSLLEVAVATAVTSILLLGIGSALLLAGRAMPDVHSPTAEIVAGADALEPMSAELQYAVRIDDRSAHEIEFRVADRNGDGNWEVIRYEWSGTAGDPLTRRYNGDAATRVLADVREFSLSYELQTISTEVPQSNESPETLLIGYDGSPDYYDCSIRQVELYSEYFHPGLPADAVRWRVTRVRFYAEQGGWPSGETSVQLQVPTAGGLPSGMVLEERPLPESSLSSWYSVRETSFTGVNDLSPQQGLCLVFQWVSGDEACRILGQERNVTASNLTLLKSIDRGISWSNRAGQSLLFSVYGTVTTRGTPRIDRTYYLDGVGICLRTGADSQATVQTRVRTLNRPEVTE
jgi:hypothetical protein